MNIPKKFIAGTAYDPVAKEVIIGTDCTLVTDGEQLTTKTDSYGDFWFEGLIEGSYSLKIEAEGKSKTISSISTEKDVNLGDNTTVLSGTAGKQAISLAEYGCDVTCKTSFIRLCQTNKRRLGDDSSYCCCG